MWLISWLSIIFYANLLWELSLNELIFTNTSNIDNFSIYIAFWIYLSIIVRSIKLILSKFKISKFFIINYILFSIIYLLSSYIWLNLIVETAILYYIFVAFWEEFMKYLIWVSYYEKWKISKNDLILYWILSAVWFAFVENIVYMIGIISGEELIPALVGWASLLLVRWLVWFIAHIVFTGNISYMVQKWLNKNMLMVYSIIWIIIWTNIHFIYDVMLLKNYWIVVPLLIIIWYIWISYIFYNSDSIYIKQVN